MKRILGLLLLGSMMLLSSCERTYDPQTLIGHWNVVGSHHTVNFRDSEIYISSTKYDCFSLYSYTASADTLYIKEPDYDGTENNPTINLPYHFTSSNRLVINGFNVILSFCGMDTSAEREKVVLIKSLNDPYN